jgi:cytochrome c2
LAPLVLVVLSVFAVAASAGLQELTLPGSVRAGEQVVREKGCLDCHALGSTGGNRAPDLAARPDDADSPSGLASALWNHSPRMWAEYSARGREVPVLDRNDVANLFSYFFATRHFEEPGLAARGRSVFIEKRCAGCHSEVLNPATMNPFLSKWSQLRDPTEWAERLWNHSGVMDTATSLRGVSWPELSGRDVADLTVFLSSLSGAADKGPALTIGDPIKGEAVFEASCQSCHTLGASERSRVDLLARQRPASLAGYVAAMWNHAPWMRRRGGALPRLSSSEMQNVVAYLFLQHYFYEAGDANRGRNVYDAKGCADCHGPRRNEVGAPDLALAIEPFSPITMGSSVWRHGSAMSESVRRQGRNWPELRARELADLIAFLNSQRKTQIAR